MTEEPSLRGRPVTWIWLLLNVAWVVLLARVVIGTAVGVFRDARFAPLNRVLAVVLVPLIALIGVAGFGVLSLAVLFRAERWWKDRRGRR
jgi:hypothetical protein